MNAVLANRRYWAGGVAMACLGVVLARIVAPHTVGSLRLGATIAGQIFALGGLVIISVGVSRRVSLERQLPPE